MSRRQRQLDELCDLCRSGGVARAVGLAFEHFAIFGRDDRVLDLLADAIERAGGPDGVRRRLIELELDRTGPTVSGVTRGDPH